MDSLEEIGALLGFVAFAGLAVLVFLTFQQARHVRRLRDWAGRAPERAAAEAAREAGEEPPLTGLDEDRTSPGKRRAEDPGTGESRWDHMREEMRMRWIEWDRHSPIDLKLLVGGIAAILVGLAIATSGFGLLGSEDGSPGSPTKAGKNEGKGSGANKEDRTTADEPAGDTEVAVLNGTAPAGGTGVPGVADRVSGDVEGAGFTVGTVDDAGSFTASVVMYSGDAQADAEELAAAMETLLGPTEVVEMTAEVEALAGGADIALVVGQDDSAV